MLKISKKNNTDNFFLVGEGERHRDGWKQQTNNCWLCFLVSLSAIFLLYRGGGNRSSHGINLDLLQVIDKLYHIMLYRVHLVRDGFELTTLVSLVSSFLFPVYLCYCKIYFGVFLTYFTTKIILFKDGLNIIGWLNCNSDMLQSVLNKIQFREWLRENTII